MQPTATPKMGKFKTSKEIIKSSWAILNQGKEIMLFPIVSTIVSLVALAFFISLYFLFATFSMTGLSQVTSDKIGVGPYIGIFVFYLVMFFIVNFFQAGMFIIVYGRFSGQNLSFSDGMRGAINNIGKIFSWSLISATVGVILDMIASRSKIIGRIVASILGAAWNIMTYFSLPSLIIGQKSIKESFKESASMIRKTWGEVFIVNVGAGLIFGLILLFVLCFCILAVILVPKMPMIITILILFIILTVIISVVSVTLNTIFKLALYVYASTGQVPQGFSSELIQSAIKTNRAWA